MKVTLYLEVVSSWCHWAEPTWARLKANYAGRATFDWRIALMDASGFPTSRAQCDWFYRRSGTLMRSPYMLNSGWFEDGRTEYLAPNLVPEAARDLGIADDRARIAIARAAVLDGRKVGRWEESVDVVSKACGLDATALLARAQGPGIEARCRKSTAEFHALNVTQRPAFLLENAIGDRAVFSGVVAYEPLAATIDTMLNDAAGYASFAAHHGGPPAI
jgi:predicted DsbA family dithiol-disulfide isomerase